MNTITVTVLPTPNLNVSTLTIDFSNFDPHDGIAYTCTFFNANRTIIDRQTVNMTGDDWQDWPPYQTAQEDYDYVKNFVLTALNLTETFSPSIVTQPSNENIDEGESVTFEVVATGSATLSYQWKKNNTDIADATTSSYTINSVQNSDAGAYTVNVTNPYGSMLSNPAFLTVNISPTILTQPQSYSAPEGSQATFNVVAQGAEPLSYQWSKDSVEILDATSSSYTINQLVLADAGDYTVTITNSLGTVTSDPANLIVTTAE
jgi:hypothetical protein